VLSKYEKRDLCGRRDYLWSEIERELSIEAGGTDWMGLYELKAALLETEIAIAFHGHLSPDCVVSKLAG
jgi:hypothetical protein